MNVGGSKLPFSEAPSFLTSRSHVTCVDGHFLFTITCTCSVYVTTPINLLRVRGIVGLHFSAFYNTVYYN